MFRQRTFKIEINAPHKFQHSISTFFLDIKTKEVGSDETVQNFMNYFPAVIFIKSLKYFLFFPVKFVYSVSCWQTVPCLQLNVKTCLLNIMRSNLNFVNISNCASKDSGMNRTETEQNFYNTQIFMIERKLH